MSDEQRACIIRTIRKHQETGISGKALQQAIAAEGFQLRSVAFYAFMAKLEDAGIVTGWNADIIIDRQRLKQRTYKLGGHLFAGMQPHESVSES